jgi:hypothetical protein
MRQKDVAASGWLYLFVKANKYCKYVILEKYIPAMLLPFLV